MELTIEIKGPRASDEALEIAAALTSVEGIRIHTPPEPSRLEPLTTILVLSFSAISAAIAVWNRIDSSRKPSYTYTVKLPNGNLLTFEGPEARRRAEQALQDYEKSQRKG